MYFARQRAHVKRAEVQWNDFGYMSELRALSRRLADPSGKLQKRYRHCWHRKHSMGIAGKTTRHITLRADTRSVMDQTPYASR